MARLTDKRSNRANDRPRDARNPQPLTCERWMTLEVRTVKPLDSVAHARALLEEHRINQLPVVRDGVLVGIVTDRDLRDAVSTTTTSAKLAGMAEAAPRTPDEISVESVMTENVITLPAQSTVTDAAVILRRERIGSAPIVDDDGRLEGIITRSDVLDAFVSREEARRRQRTQHAPVKR